MAWLPHRQSFIEIALNLGLQCKDGCGLFGVGLWLFEQPYNKKYSGLPHNSSYTNIPTIFCTKSNWPPNFHYFWNIFQPWKCVALSCTAPVLLGRLAAKLFFFFFGGLPAHYRTKDGRLISCVNFVTPYIHSFTSNFIHFSIARNAGLPWRFV